MKEFVFLPLLLILSFYNLQAQTNSDTLANEQPDTVKIKGSFVFGGDFIMTGVADMPFGGIGVKFGVRYQVKKIHLWGLIGYSSVERSAIWGDWKTTTTRWFPHLMLSSAVWNLTPYFIVGAGSGNFKAFDAGNTGNSRKAIFGYGGGAKYKWIVLGVMFYRPEFEATARNQWGTNRNFSSNDVVQFNLGILLAS